MTNTPRNWFSDGPLGAIRLNTVFRFVFAMPVIALPALRTARIPRQNAQPAPARSSDTFRIGKEKP